MEMHSLSVESDIGAISADLWNANRLKVKQIREKKATKSRYIAIGMYDANWSEMGGERARD